MSELFLGIIAASTLLMALIQVGAIIYAGRMAGRIERAVQKMETDVKPLVDRLTAVSADAARASTLVVAQLERVDKLISDLAVRVDETLAQVQQAIVVPAREGLALIAGLRAAFNALRGERPRGRGHQREEEDPLFIG